MRFFVVGERFRRSPARAPEQRKGLPIRKLRNTSRFNYPKRFFHAISIFPDTDVLATAGPSETELLGERLLRHRLSDLVLGTKPFSFIRRGALKIDVCLFLRQLFVTVMTYLVIIVQYDEGDSQKAAPLVQNCSDYYGDDYDVYANY